MSGRTAGQTVACGWCGSPITVKARGRIPKWCGPTCRHRAWEQRRAAASGRAPVEVVQQTVTVERVVERLVERPAPPPRVSPPTSPRRPTTADEWRNLLVELGRQVEDGELTGQDRAAVYARVITVNEAFKRAKRRKRR